MATNRIRTLTRTAPYLSSSTLHTLFNSFLSSSSSRNTWRVFSDDDDPPPPANTGGRSSSVYQQALKSQRPPTIKYSDDLSNSVSFIGTVNRPVRRFDTATGKLGACTSLSVNSPSNPNRSCRVLLKMWDGMAEMCLEHIKQDDFLYVSGHIETYTKEYEDGKPQRYYEVIVKEVNYVQQRDHSLNKKNDDQLSSRVETGAGKHRNCMHSWKLFFANPSEWCDHRRTKINPKHPDFKHKDTGEALWIHSYDPLPPWVKQQLQLHDSKFATQNRKEDSQSGETGAEKYRDRVHLWQLFFANPSEWWDNRKTKIKPNYPDFKHKDTDEALWISSYDPPWVMQQLQLYESKFATRYHKEDSQSGMSTFV